MATIYYDEDADLRLLTSRKVGVVGYGSQGHAHALNLKESDVDVRVGLYTGSRSWRDVEQEGLEVGTVDEVAKWADLVMMLVPDTTQKAIYERDVEPNLAPGDALFFAHGSTSTSTRSSLRTRSTYAWSRRRARDTSSGGCSPRASAYRPSWRSNRTRRAMH